MNKKVIIIGAGENGMVIAQIIKKMYTLEGFLEDNPKNTSKGILGTTNDLERYITKCSFFISIGSNDARKQVFEKLSKYGAHFVNAIHPLSNHEDNVELGVNIFLGAHSYINGGSTIANGTFINNGCIIEHDNTVGSFSHVAPGVITGGGVHIGDNTFIGLGSRINDHISIGDSVVVGSGSVVINPLPNFVTAVGTPAKIIKQHNNE